LTNANSTAAAAALAEDPLAHAHTSGVDSVPSSTKRSRKLRTIAVIGPLLAIAAACVVAFATRAKPSAATSIASSTSEPSSTSAAAAKPVEAETAAQRPVGAPAASNVGTVEKPAESEAAEDPADEETSPKSTAEPRAAHATRTIVVRPGQRVIIRRRIIRRTIVTR
jgi:hypothetical protein